jgi:hypothetical protein
MGKKVPPIVTITYIMETINIVLVFQHPSLRHTSVRRKTSRDT